MALPTRRTMEPRRVLPRLRGWTRKFSSFLRFQKYRSDEVAVSTVIVALDGTGDYDDIQAAIDSLPDTGGRIVIKEGTYNITSVIDINKDNVELIGSGRASKITTSAGISLITASNQTRLLIQNLFLYCSGLTTGGILLNNGIIFVTVTKSIISNCWIENGGSGKAAIVLASNSEENIISGNKVNNNNGLAIGILSSYNHIISNQSNNNGNDGIIINGVRNVINGNEVNTNTYSGITLEGTTTYNIISSNICYDNTQAGVSLEGATSHNVVEGNILKNNGAGQIVDEGTNNQIGHNVTT